MARYLVVAHQTATSPLLLQRAEEIARADPGAEFTLLIPATHVWHALTWNEDETLEVARWRAREAQQAFADRGLRVAGTEIGDDSPVAAVEDELRSAPDAYDAVILSTLPPGVSRWLHLDIPARVSRRYTLPVFQVMEGGDQLWEASAELRREVARSGRPVAVAPPPREPGRLDRREWFLATAGSLLALHVVVMLALGALVDPRFFIAEAVMLLFFLAMVTVVWQVGGPSLRRQ